MSEQKTLYPIEQISLEEEMQRSYLDYAMSVIVSRALPDIRDGLKPVHRRILYAMKEGGYVSDKPFRKSARIVGDVMGKYHPHGDSPIYDSMVRMAQDFSMRLMLVDGQGNFGSMDGDRAAAMRYTEARLSQAAERLLQDIDYETVDFKPNYDESEKEPVILPSRLPNLLINGSSGIAVGMATNIPPHNPSEVIDACIALINDPDIDIEGLMAHIQGPDFPTGGEILRVEELRTAYETGRGTILVRSRCHIEEDAQNREQIIVTEIPYQVNKSRLIERIAESIKEGKITGISDLRDESNRKGVRIVIVLKKDAQSEVVLSCLHKFSPLQVNFSFNMLALDAQKPRPFTLKRALQAFLEFREEVILRKTNFLLKKARERAHLLAGLMLAISNLDEVILLIRNAPDPTTARNALQNRKWQASHIQDFLTISGEAIENTQTDELYALSEKQARAILDLRLHRLTGLEREKILEETHDLGKEITNHLEILRVRRKRFDIMREELLEVKEKFASPRRSMLNPESPDTPLEDLIPQEDVVVTVTGSGYIKRVPLSTYRAQKRGGKGRSGMNVRDQDFIQEIFMTSTHTTMLFFSNRGMAYRIKVYELPAGAPQHRGKPLVNLLPLKSGEEVSTVMPFPEESDSSSTIIFATRKGNVRRNHLSDFANVHSGGKIAMKLDDDDCLISILVCKAGQDITLASRQGSCVRFPVENVRIFQSRSSSGVRGIKLSGDDEVVSMSLLDHTETDIDSRTPYLRGAMLQRRTEQDHVLLELLEPEDEAFLKEWRQNAHFDQWRKAEQFLLTFTENGFGKRSSAYEYRTTRRGGSGIRNIKTTEKTGKVVASFPVEQDDQIIMATDQGQLMRFPVKDIRICGRTSQGVTLFRISEGERVVSAALLCDDQENEDET